MLKVNHSATVIEELQAAQRKSRQGYEQKIAQLSEEISQLKHCGVQVLPPSLLASLTPPSCWSQIVSLESTTHELRQQLLQQQVSSSPLPPS